MRTRMFVLMIVVIIAAGLLSCQTNEQQQSAADRLAQLANNEQQLKNAQEQIISLQSENRQKSATIVAYQDSLTASRAVHDSLSRLVVKRQHELALCRTSIRIALDQLDETTAFFESTVNKCHDTLATRTQQLAQAHRQILVIEGANTTLRTEKTQARTWMHFYQQKSERSIFKHLFGAGVPSQPDVPYPGD